MLIAPVGRGRRRGGAFGIEGMLDASWGEIVRCSCTPRGPAPGRHRKYCGRWDQWVICRPPRDLCYALASMSGPRTIVDKIWDDHVVSQDEGAPAVLAVDLHLVHEV